MPELATQLADFHFLRPYWLLLLLLIPLIYLWSGNYRRRGSSWAQAIDRHLLEHLLEQKATRASRKPFYLIMLCLLLTTIALAGPVWKKIPQPVHKAEDALVLVMDLSLSMRATDISPSRLVKARHKLIDILERRDKGQTALVAYAGDAHIVAPLTDDTGTVKAMVPALAPLIMPAFGSRPDLAVSLAQQLLKDGGINSGHILLVTDGISTDDADSLTEIMDSGRHRFSMLAVGTAEGAPISLPEQGFLKDGQEIVIAKTDLEPLQRLAQTTGARLAQLQLDDSDIDYLLQPELLDLNTASRQVEREFDQWHEQGPWLLLLLAPLVALAFRRGWLLSLFLLLLLEPAPVYALDWHDLWKTPDQQGAEAFAAGEHEQAAKLFESKDWQASAAYRAGDYQQAAQAFAAQEGVEANYNLGNALAKAGELEAALKAYEKALEQSPGHEDAQFNKNLIEQLLQNQQNNQQQDQNGENNQQGEDGQSGDGSQQPQQSGESQNNPEQNSGQQDSGERQQNQQEQEKDASGEEQQQQGQKEQQKEQQGEQQQAQQPGEEGKEGEESEGEPQQLAQPEMSDEQRQAMEQWLRRIPEDPGGLLRRKFNHQYRQRQLENQFQPPPEDQQLW